LIEGRQVIRDGGARVGHQAQLIGGEPAPRIVHALRPVRAFHRCQ
jgi:hypothetical protein